MSRFSNGSPESSVSDPAQLQRILQGANDAAMLRHRLALIDIEGAHRLAMYRSHFNPDQPRVPAGHPDGGQWTKEGSSTGRLAALDPVHGDHGLIRSDTGPGGIKVWTKYAEAKTPDEPQSKSDADPEAAADAAPANFGTDVHTAFAARVRALNLPGSEP